MTQLADPAVPPPEPSSGSPEATPANPATGTSPAGSRRADPRGRPAAGWGGRFGVSLLALSTGYAATLAWGPLVASPADHRVPGIFLAVLLAILAATLRARRTPATTVALAQVLVTLLVLNQRASGEDSFSSAVPTIGSLGEMGVRIGEGAWALTTYVSPVAEAKLGTAVLLLACTATVMIAVDLLAVGWRRVALAGLVVLATLTVPTSVLVAATPWWIFAITALLFLRLVAAEQVDRILGWGRVATAGRSRLRGSNARLARLVDQSALLRRHWQVSVAAVIGALLLAAVVPVTNLLERDGVNDLGRGARNITVANPLVDMRRDLNRGEDVPLVFASNDSGATNYLRTTVLDQFNGRDWRPSPRRLPQENQADGEIESSAPGQDFDLPVRERPWELALAGGFETQWLPLPYPSSEVQARGGWLYDDRTMDFVTEEDVDTGGLEYQAVQEVRQIDPAQLDDAGRAPSSLSAPMTSLPAGLPDVIAERAREVTRGATTDFEKAVALQRWFREDGGFEYSLNRRPGSGAAALARFVTNERVGYCEQYAAAMATMARTLDIPARVAVGFLSGDRQEDGTIVYSSHDLHAWPEIFFDGIGWVHFEPTPGQRAAEPPRWTTAEAGAEAPQPTQAPTAVPSVASDVTPQTAPNAPEESSGTLRQVLTGMGVLLLLGLLGAPALFRAWQRRRRLDPDRPATEVAEGAWRELEASAQDFGFAWPRRRSAREQSASLRGQLAQFRAGQTHSPDQIGTAIDQLTRAVEEARYASPDLARRSANADEAGVAVGVLSETMSESRGRAARVRRLVAPRSVFDGIRRRR